MTFACIACYGPFAEGVSLRVGELFGAGRVERILLCARCKNGIWNPWGMRK